MKPLLCVLALLLLFSTIIRAETGDFSMVDDKSTAQILVDSKDYPVISLAANLFADDVNRVTGKRPEVSNKPSANNLVVAGTIGHSEWIDQLIAAGKIKDAGKLKGQWEATSIQVVENPFANVPRALVIVGSDRRGTAYGLMQLSEKIGVSPWYWWADVPVMHRDSLSLAASSFQIDSPKVKYRGIFINDEDWGLHAWAKNTFEPEFKGIGPKTYEKVFELMLRLRLNYIWPAMHPCTTEFGTVKENYELADKFGIVVGSSHAEPMLCNNVKWDVKKQGPWDYTKNRETIYRWWEDTAKARGPYEAVWTLGLRGIHDSPMNGAKDTRGRIAILDEVLKDQQALLEKNVNKEWGEVAQAFVPYKEVQPIYDGGLKVPENATLVWADDNFGYIRRFSSPDERKRTGGAGFYYHISYYGAPHSYTWINTTSPAQMWLEMHKAWENDARSMWVINVGDIKPMEIGIDYFSRLAWNPELSAALTSPAFLNDFASRILGAESGTLVAPLLGEFYRLAWARKPELMNRAWAMNMTADEAKEFQTAYGLLLKKTDEVEKSIAPAGHDAYVQLVGSPSRILAGSGLLFLADRNVQLNIETESNSAEVKRLKDFLEAQVKQYNTQIAGGKWNLMMPGLVTGKYLTAWNSQVRWPWGEDAKGASTTPTTKPAAKPATILQPPAGLAWRDASTSASARSSDSSKASWIQVNGLGRSGTAMSLQPATLDAGFDPEKDLSLAPRMEFDFHYSKSNGPADPAVYIDFLPAFRLIPGMQLRVAVQLDGAPPQLVEVPGSGGTEDERGAVRQQVVQDNCARAKVPLPALTEGKHTLKIIAVDPGATVDRICLP